MKYVQISIKGKWMWVSEDEAEDLINDLKKQDISVSRTKLASIELGPQGSDKLNEIVKVMYKCLKDRDWSSLTDFKWGSIDDTNVDVNQRKALPINPNYYLGLLMLEQLNVISYELIGQPLTTHDAVVVRNTLSDMSKDRTKKREFHYVKHAQGNTLESTLALASDIRSEVRAFIPLGSSAPEIGFAKRKLLERKEGIQPSKDDLAMLRLIVESEIKLKFTRASKGSIDNIVRSSRAGNCTERALLAFNFLQLRKLNILGECIRIFTPPNVHLKQGLHKGDHVFLVINRSYLSDENNPLTWGPNAVICDPWSDDEFFGVYPAPEYAELMKNYYHDPVLGSSVESIDLGPDGCHRLEVLISNMDNLALTALEQIQKKAIDLGIPLHETVIINLRYQIDDSIGDAADAWAIREMLNHLSKKIDRCATLLSSIKATQFGEHDSKIEQYMGETRQAISSADLKLDEIIMDLEQTLKGLQDPRVKLITDIIHRLETKSMLPSAKKKAHDILIKMGNVPLNIRSNILHSTTPEALAVLSAMKASRTPFGSGTTKTFERFRHSIFQLEALRAEHSEDQTPGNTP